MPCLIRPRICRSWLDVDGGRILAAKLANRLISRCVGERGVMLTLTYNREGWNNARDLWRESNERQHVALFMRRLGRAIRMDLGGRWLCKAEFQRGGWVHWHIVLLGVEHIEHERLERSWGHGFVWINRITPGRLKYACKYVSKAGGIAPFLLGERRVRIVRTSAGFWGEDDKEQDREELDAVDEPCRPTQFGYVSVGERIRRARLGTIVRDEAGRVASIERPIHEVVTELQRRGVAVGRGGQGWIGVCAEIDDVVSASTAAGIAGGRLHSTEWHKDDGIRWLEDVIAWSLRSG